MEKHKSLIKLRNKLTSDVYYRFPHWSTKDIDGITFIGVVKNPPTQEHTQNIFWMRKDSLERVK